MSDQFYVKRTTPEDSGLMASVYIPPNTTPISVPPPKPVVPGATHHEPDMSFDYSRAIREHAEREARRFYVFSHGGGARAAPAQPNATGWVMNPPPPAVPPGGVFTTTHATHPTVVQMAGGVPLPPAASFGAARVQPVPPPLSRVPSRPVVEHPDNASTTSLDAAAFGHPLPLEVLPPAPAVEVVAPSAPPPPAVAPPALPTEEALVEEAELPVDLLCDETLPPAAPAAAEPEPAPKPKRVRKAVEFQSNSVDRPKRSCAGRGVQRYGFSG